MLVEMFFDTACPWCRVGQRHLQLALAQWQAEPVSVRYRSYVQDPSIPPEGLDFRAYMLAKGQGKTPLGAFFDGPQRAGTAAGLAFRFWDIERTPNTLLSHRLLALAPEQRTGDLLQAVFEAYFARAQDIGDLEVLVVLAANLGLDAGSLRRQLQGEGGLPQVQADQQRAATLGIRDVPFFLLAGRVAFGGAQTPEGILRGLRVAARPITDR
ncbi:MAG: DsbA family oxidoreductase [Anaerolineae bacterium]|nr:DsbA family oxidoreductase [Anaerolineae bacterium]